MISTIWLHADQQYLTKCSYNKGTGNNYLPPFSGLDLRYNATVLKIIIVDISIYIGLVWKISFNTCCQLWPKLWFVDLKTQSNIRHSVHCLQYTDQFHQLSNKIYTILINHYRGVATTQIKINHRWECMRKYNWSVIT